MSNETILIIALIIYAVAREIFFFIQVHKLINKLMSRNYWEYTRAGAGPLPDIAPSKNVEKPEDFDDLGVLF